MYEIAQIKQIGFAAGFGLYLSYYDCTDCGEIHGESAVDRTTTLPDEPWNYEPISDFDDATTR